MVSRDVAKMRDMLRKGRAKGTTIDTLLVILMMQVEMVRTTIHLLRREHRMA